MLTDLPRILSAAAGGEISLLWSIPFVALLLCTALTPLFSIKFWHHHYAKFAIGFGLITAVYYLFVRREPGPWLHEMRAYFSFMLLLGSLYVVSGGIFIRISRVATPVTNCVLLLIGAIIANVVGTTGASMLLIRPFLRINRAHVRAYHVVFFIFIVSNCGGLLTPIGDPPLFLGFLQGVPFWWVFYECHKMWFFVIVALLAVFFMIDHLDHRVNRRQRPDDEGPAVYINGLQNFIWVAVILYSIFRPSTFDVISQLRGGFSVDRLGSLLLSRELLMIVAILASRWFTPREIYQRNEFNYDAIREVAILFLGIFSTMVPALQWLANNAHRMPLERPAHYYFACGGLSAALDNAPTYLTFLQVKLGRQDRATVDEVYRIAQGMVERRTLNIPDDIADENVRRALDQMVRYNAPTFRRVSIDRRDAEIAVLLSDPRSAMALVAVSLGAVFFGAMTYIGNGPNFMVKSIAESQGVPTPTFLGYIGKYALPMLLPILIAVWFIFLRGG